MKAKAIFSFNPVLGIFECTTIIIHEEKEEKEKFVSFFTLKTFEGLKKKKRKTFKNQSATIFLLIIDVKNFFIKIVLVS